MPLKATSTSGNANSEVLERRRARDRARVGQHLGLEHEQQPERHHQQLQHQVGEHDQRRALEAPRRAAAHVGDRDRRSRPPPPSRNSGAPVSNGSQNTAA